MNLFYASIASGSNGNCYYVGTQDHGVLVDAGIYGREIEKRMQRIKLSIHKVRAVFITHEHSDHVRGLATIATKHNIPVHLSQGTYNKIKDNLRNVNYKFILDEVPVIVEDMIVYPFKKVHDAANPYSFIVEHKKIRIGVITDIGYACDNVIRNFTTCHAAFLEANYDHDMLVNGRYPAHLKERIMSERGHLSNEDALKLFLNHRHPGMSHLILTHLSEENNDSEAVYNLFIPKSDGVRINVASRYSESKLYQINRRRKPVKMEEDENKSQLTLF